MRRFRGSTGRVSGARRTVLCAGHEERRCALLTGESLGEKVDGERVGIGIDVVESPPLPEPAEGVSRGGSTRFAANDPSTTTRTHGMVLKYALDLSAVIA